MQSKKKTLFKFFLIFFSLAFLIEIVYAETTYTPTTDTICKEGTCTLSLYSNIRNVYENNQWKKIENARSLKDKGFDIVFLENDSNFPLEVIDFNYTSISVDLKKFSIFGEDIPIRIWKSNHTLERQYQKDVEEGKKMDLGLLNSYKDRYEKVYESSERFSLLDGAKRRTYNFGLNAILEFGFNSTTIQINDSSIGILDMCYLDSSNSPNSCVNDGHIKVGAYPTNEFFRGLIKVNISSVPAGVNITESILATYLTTNTFENGDNEVLEIYGFNNYTWNESIISWNNLNDSNIDDLIVSNNSLQDMSGLWVYSNVTSFINATYDGGNLNVSLFINITEDGSENDYLAFWSQTYGTASLRPYLNVTYTSGADSTPPYINITSPTNSSNLSSLTFDLNYTYIETNAGYCWYSNNSGTTNSTPVSMGTNWTDLIGSENSNNRTIYCNDTTNNINSSLPILFTIDTINPNINITSPANNTNSSDNTLEINYTRNDTNLDSCWYSNDSFASNTTLASCGNITGVTWIEGTHNVTIWINDSMNNINQSELIFFTIDTTNPLISLNLPVNYTNTTDTTPEINYTYTEINSDTCWWGNDTKNTTLASCGTNITGITFGEGLHNITIWINDTSGNTNSTTKLFFTIDTTSPYFTDISNQTLQNGTLLNYDINATDTYTLIDCFKVNDTTNFKIYCNGTITNITALNVSYHTLNITINDTTNNLNSTLWAVNVTGEADSTLPYINITSPLNNSEFNTLKINISLNITATDSSGISTYWWSKNEGATNFSFSQNQTWVSFQEESGTYNYTIMACVNDTSNNINCSYTNIIVVVQDSELATGRGGGSSQDETTIPELIKKIETHALDNLVLYLGGGLVLLYFALIFFEGMIDKIENPKKKNRNLKKYQYIYRSI